MTLADTLAYTRLRLRKRWVWVGVLALWIPSTASRFLFESPKMPAGPEAWIYTIAMPFCLFASLAWLAPMPWLWTGQPGERPKAWRGVLQSLVFGACTIGLLVILDMAMSHRLLSPIQAFFRKAAEVNLTVAVVFCLVGFGTVALDQAGWAREEAERREREAQWILLRGQVNPHVFFNAMTSLTELIAKDARAAETAALDLTDLLRRLMAHGHRHLAPLAEERSLVERYLAVESLRLGARLRTVWDWDPALDRVEAPPFLLQPLVENALKHGIGPSAEGGELGITGRLRGDRVDLSVSNGGRPFHGRASGGLGLENLEARLKLAFGSDARFSLASAGDRTRAQVSFPAPQELA